AKEQLVTKETTQEGSVSWRTYHQYCKAAGGYMVALCIGLIFIVLVGTTAFSTWWLSYWLHQGSGGNSSNCSSNISENPDLHFYQLIYGLTILAMILLGAIKGYSFTKVILHASSNLHNSMFKRILYSPMSFFDTTPTGRIMNRFSRDQDETESRLLHDMDYMLQYGLLMVYTIISISVVFPMILIAVAVLGLICAAVLYIFQGSIRHMKRL
ncbi:hypothetical protein JZ751_003502, partial [Albula glossodonta]